MPQPRQPSAAQQRAATAGAAAAAVGPVAAGGGIAGVAAGDVAAASVIAQLVAALKPRVDVGDEGVFALVLGLLDDRYPDRPKPERIDLARLEQDYERTFQARMVARLQRDLPRAFAITDPAERRRAVEAIIAREKRAYQQRQEAMYVRALAHADQLYLQDSSPDGAYWMLSAYVKEHTLDCLAMAHKFWPWEVLRREGPPRHYGCPCYLLGKDEAKRLGYMTDADVGDPAEAAARAAALLRRVQEATSDGLLTSDVVADYLGLLEAREVEEVEEAPHEPLRWAKGTATGGEFRPVRGGPRPSLLRRLERVLPHPPQPPAQQRQEARWTPAAGGSGGRPVGVPSYDGVDLEVGKSAGGSNGARWATDPHGDKWLVKSYRGNEDRVATEALANAVYREMGARVARAGTMDLARDPDFRDIPDAKIDEPPMPKSQPGRRRSTGVILREPDGRVWIVRPKGGFGGYDATLPKGGLEYGLSTQQNAHKEVWEETGLHAAITGFAGDQEGDTGVTRFYVGVRTGGDPLPPDPTPYEEGGRETASVELVTPEEAFKALNRERDRAALKAALQHPLPLPGADVAGQDAPAFPAQTSHALAYPILDGAPKRGAFRKGPSHELSQHFMTDALLGNWDFVGLEDDNVLWDGEGHPIRVDQGGTFEFRAQGKSKPYGPVPSEVWTMLGPRGQGFRSVALTSEEKRRQAADITHRLTPERVDALVDAAPFRDEAMRERIRENLKARVGWMGRYAAGEEHEPTPLTGQAAHDALMADAPELDPDEQWAADAYGEDEGELADALRGGQLDGREGDIVRLVDGIVAQQHAPQDMVVYVPVSSAGDDGMVGKTFRERAYLDGQIDPPKDSPGVLRVSVPAGTPLMYAPAVGGDQRRVVLPRGRRLAIVRRAAPYLDAVLAPDPAPLFKH